MLRLGRITRIGHQFDRFPAVFDHHAGGLGDAVDEAVPAREALQDDAARLIPGQLIEGADLIDGQDQITQCRRWAGQDTYGKHVSRRLAASRGRLWLLQLVIITLGQLRRP